MIQLIINMTLGEKIKKIRQDNNLTQEGFAEKLFISRKSVSEWEHDNYQPSYDNLLLICKTFNLDLFYFFDEFKKEDDNKLDNNPSMNNNEKEIIKTKEDEEDEDEEEIIVDGSKYNILRDIIIDKNKIHNYVKSMKRYYRKETFISYKFLIIAVIIFIISTILGSLCGFAYFLLYFLNIFVLKLHFKSLQAAKEHYYLKLFSRISKVEDKTLICSSYPLYFNVDSNFICFYKNNDVITKICIGSILKTTFEYSSMVSPFVKLKIYVREKKEPVRIFIDPLAVVPILYEKDFYQYTVGQLMNIDKLFK